MDTSSLTIPWISTTEEPFGNCEISLRISRARRLSSFGSRLPASPINAPGLRLRHWETIGGKASAGKFEIPSTRFLTSLRKRVASILSSPSTLTRALPSRATESICSRPSIPSSASSIRRINCSSTSRGDAPGHPIEIVAPVKVADGFSSRSRFMNAKPPAIKQAIISRLAATELRAHQPINPVTAYLHLRKP